MKYLDSFWVENPDLISENHKRDLSPWKTKIPEAQKFFWKKDSLINNVYGSSYQSF